MNDSRSSIIRPDSPRTWTSQLEAGFVHIYESDSRNVYNLKRNGHIATPMQTMETWICPATQRTFATAELLEHILIRLLDGLLPLTDREDPRSVRTHANATVLEHILRCMQVSTDWRDCIIGSSRLRRALFWAPDPKTNRSWNIAASATRARLLYSYYTAPHLRAPQLNPVIQTTFPAYHFRFWHLGLESTNNKGPVHRMHGPGLLHRFAGLGSQL